MTQQELTQLKVLLEKAKAVLPGATEFVVHEDARGCFIRGWENDIEHGHITQSDLALDGSIQVMEFRIN